jgi:2,4-dienoyl-CoA reductase-like NADH-dependent reductase (Old Yellow Enzyme family)/thioredoxin reductase
MIWEEEMLDALKDSIRIRNLTIRNRVVMPPMVTRFASERGGVTRQLIDYHAERSKGGVGLQIVESTQIQDEPMALLKIYSDTLTPGLNELAESIKMWGARAGIQINHWGLLSPDQLSTDQISSLIEDFASAASRAKMAGFDLVEIHGAHAYLIAQLLSARTNHRTDEWGGTWEKRANFVLAVIRRIREKIGNDFPLSLRISGDEFLEGGRTIEETERLAPLFVEAGIDLLHISGGGPESRERTALPMVYPRGALVHLAERIKKCVKIPVAAVGRINDPILADQVIREGKADLVSFGRALLADPHLPRKAFSGKFDEIRKCTACMDCRMRVADLGWKMKCSVNPDLGREGESALTIAKKPRRVMIIGGGPAGMEAARIAKLRGHRVTLYERGKKLGGQLLYATAPPHKEELKNLLDFLSNQMKLLKVSVRLETEINARAIQKAKPDAVIVATGSKPILPSFTGKAKVLTYHEILKQKLPKGENFLIIGGGSLGCELAEYLAEKGKKVSVVEILEQIAADAQSDARRLLAQRLKEKKVTIHNRSQVQKIEGGKATLINHEGKPVELEAEVIVTALGGTPDPVSLKGVEKLKLSPQVYFAGDCRQSGKILQAIHDGNRVGRMV